jgi:protein-S-isoprenylcysteine O-methyltransferase Ste14
VAVRTAARAAVVVAYAILFWILLPLGLWAAARAADTALGWRAPPRPAGWVLAAGGMGLALWAIAVLQRHGGGLPVSALPPPRLVERGPYRYVRHPIYLGFNVAILGAGLGLGSPGLTWMVAPLFLPAWLSYATVEERGLLRRFGDRYRSYRRRVGRLPRYGIYLLAFAAVGLRLLPVRSRGREHVPRRGGALLVHNHACYADFLLAGSVAAPRRLAFLVTAEAYRHPVQRLLLGRAITVGVRRYRTDPAACRELLRMLEAGLLVVVAPEGERATLGRRLRPLPGVARILSRLGYPVIPVGISGSYDVGPRWAGVLRRRPVSLRVGPPVDWSRGDPVQVLDEALGALVDGDPQPVRLAGIPPGRIEVALWRCPRCLGEAGWRAPALACQACGASWKPTPDGLLQGPGSSIRTLAEVADPVWGAQEAGPLRAQVQAARERSLVGPMEPLEPMGTGELEIGPGGLRFPGLVLPLRDLRSATVERNDTLQVATADAMWQFRLARGSAFRLQLALDAWRGAAPTAYRPPAAPREGAAP